MDVFEAIKNRRSVRSYKAEPVPEGKLRKVLEAGRLAPSAHNAQDWKFIVVREAEKRKKLAKAAGQNFIAKASVVIAAVGLDPEHFLPSENPAYAINLAIALDHMALMATAEGLGTCWIGAFSQVEVKRILNIPEQYKVVALLLLGFAADLPGAKSRKSLKEIISYEKFT